LRHLVFLRCTMDRQHQTDHYQYAGNQIEQIHDEIARGHNRFNTASLSRLFAGHALYLHLKGSCYL